VVKLETGSNQDGLLIRPSDLLDAPRLLDIKPYVPYATALLRPRNGFAEQATAAISVEWSPTCPEAGSQPGSSTARQPC